MVTVKLYKWQFIFQFPGIDTTENELLGRNCLLEMCMRHGCTNYAYIHVCVRIKQGGKLQLN